MQDRSMHTYAFEAFAFLPLTFIMAAHFVRCSANFTTNNFRADFPRAHVYGHRMIGYEE